MSMWRSSWVRRTGSRGNQSMSRTIGGGQATTTRLARTVPREVRTTTRPSFCSMRFTAASSATASPSFLARRSGISWDPPTSRLSWAPFAVSELREKVPTVVSLPEQATYQSTKSSDSSSGSAPKPGWVQDLMRLPTPLEFRALRRMNSPRLIASHARAFGCDHGALTSISAAIESSRVSRIAASGRIVGSGGTVPEYS